MAASDDVGAKLFEKVRNYLQTNQDPAWAKLAEVVQERESMRDFTDHENEKVDRALVLGSTIERLLEKNEWRGQSERLSKEGNDTGPDFLAFERFVRECQSLFELVSHVLEVCNKVLALCKAAFIPEELHFVETSSKLEKIYVFFKFDHEGRPIYRIKMKNPPPRLRRGDVEEPMLEPGSWEVRWNRDRWEMGHEACKWELASVLATDAGIWEPTGTHNAGRRMRARAGGKRLLSEVQVRELREIVFRGGAGGEDKEGKPQVADVVAKTCEMLGGVFAQDVKLVQHANQLLDSLQIIARKLELKKGGEQGQYVMPVVGPSDSVPLLQEKLVRLSSLSHNAVLERLKATLPKYKKEQQSGLINECMTLNCRLLDLSDMRNVEESFLPRLFHRFCLFHWQQEHPEQTMYLDLSTGEEKHGKSLPTKEAKAVRMVAVSDTHGWDADIELPLGEVLIHCGDMSFEASPWAGDAPIPGDFKAQMLLFNTPRYRKYQWIFMVPGNHDQPLFDIWSREPQKLFDLMPDNLILLQAYTYFPNSSSNSNLCSGAAKHPEHRECVEDGAVWLYPEQRGPRGTIKLTLRKPSEKNEGDGGWIIAGSGVSLKKNDWSANRAFQLLPSEAERTKEAARCLLQHNPHIVLSHGPPRARDEDTKPRWDEDRGDEELRKALDGSDSWAVTLFGHSHENHGVVHRRQDGKLLRLFVNAAISTQVYVPTRPPIVFDLSVHEDLRMETAEEGGRGDTASWWASCCGCTRFCRPPEPNEGRLVADWDLPTEFIAPRILDVWQEEQDEAAKAVHLAREDGRCGPDQPLALLPRVEDEERAAREATRLSEFHGCGPAVQWGFQTICSWFFALVVTVLAYFVTGKPWRAAYWPFQSAPEPECLEERSDRREGCAAFVEYPLGLWVLHLIPCAHTLWVQRKCLTYVILGQVHELGRGFKLGRFKVSFQQWLIVAHVCTFVGLTDITTQSLFLVQVLKSVQINRQIDTVWKETIHQSWMVGGIPGFDNITFLFGTCLIMTLLQAVYIVLHLFPTHDEGVSYECKSMRDGYTTLASSLFCFEVDYKVSRNEGGARRMRRKYWHADVLRILAYYGRMPALVWEESGLMKARVERQKKSRELVRYLQILFNRQQEFLVRLILLDILEKGLKLEIQISVFAIDMALQRDQTSPWSIMNKQMFFAIGVGFLSLGYAIHTHIQMHCLLSVTGEIEADDVHWQNKREGEQNLQRFKTWRRCYTFTLGVLALIVFHCFVKFVMAFSCQFSLSNNFMQCAIFDYTGTRDNRSLFFGNVTTG